MCVVSVFSEHQIRMMRASVIDERREAAKKRHKLALRIFPACMVGVVVGSFGDPFATVGFVLAGCGWLWFWAEGQR